MKTVSHVGHEDNPSDWDSRIVAFCVDTTEHASGGVVRVLTPEMNSNINYNYITYYVGVHG